MKKQYIFPAVSEQTLSLTGIICVSGGAPRISSSVVTGGENSGDIEGAF